jgi:hypothetical protein
MATELVTSLGYTVSVEDGEPATFDQAGFADAAMIYDEIVDVTEVTGDIGFTFNTATAVTLKDGITKTAKGAITFNPLTIQVLNTASTGLTTLKTSAATQRGQVSLKLEDADANIIYLCGVVTQDTKAVGNADAVQMQTFTFTPNYSPIYV